MRLQDLKRGMRCTYRDGGVFTVGKVDDDGIHYLFDKGGIRHSSQTQDDLTNGSFYELDIMKVEDITEYGYEVIWKREDEKYYLRLPNSWRDVGGYLIVRRDTGEYDVCSNTENNFWQTQFTLEEIDNLPHQNFIRSLTKEKVE